MVPKSPKDKEQIGRIGEPGLFLVSDRTTSWEWECLPRRELPRPRERLGPIRSGTTRSNRRLEGKDLGRES
jgi:hypothetical protein